MPAICPARAANVATHAWTKPNDEFMIMSLTVSGVYECRSCRAWLALPEATSTTVHVCTAFEWPTVDGRKKHKPEVATRALTSLQVTDAAPWQPT